MNKKALRNKVNFLENNKYHVKAYKAKKMWLFAGLFALALGGSAVTANANNNVHADTTNGNSGTSNINTQKEQNKSTLVTNNANANNANNTSNANAKQTNPAQSVQSNSNNVAQKQNSNQSALNRVVRHQNTLGATPTVRRSQVAGPNVNFDATPQNDQEFRYYNVNDPSNPVGTKYYQVTGENSSRRNNENAAMKDSNVPTTGTGRSKVSYHVNINNINQAQSNALDSVNYTANGQNYNGNLTIYDIPVVPNANGVNYSYVDDNTGSPVYVKSFQGKNDGSLDSTANGAVPNGYHKDTQSGKNNDVDNQVTITLVDSADNTKTHKLTPVNAGKGDKITVTLPSGYTTNDSQLSQIPKGFSVSSNNKYVYTSDGSNNPSFMIAPGSKGWNNSNDLNNSSVKTNLANQTYISNDGKQYYGTLATRNVNVVPEANAYQYQYKDQNHNQQGSWNSNDQISQSQFQGDTHPVGIKDGYYYNNGNITQNGTSPSNFFKDSDGNSFYGPTINYSVPVQKMNQTSHYIYNYLLNNNPNVIVGSTDSTTGPINVSSYSTPNLNSSYYKYGKQTDADKMSNGGQPHDYYDDNGNVLYGKEYVQNVNVNSKLDDSNGNPINGNQNGNVPVNGEKLVGSIPISVNINGGQGNGGKTQTLNLDLASLPNKTPNGTNNQLYVGDTYTLNGMNANGTDDSTTNSNENSLFQKYVSSNLFNGAHFNEDHQGQNGKNGDPNQIEFMFANYADAGDDGNGRTAPDTDANDNYLELYAKVKGANNWSKISRVNGNSSQDSSSDDGVDFNITNSQALKDFGSQNVTLNYTEKAKETANIYYTNYEGDLVNASDNTESTNQKGINTTAAPGAIVRWNSDGKTSNGVKYYKGQAVSGDFVNANKEIFKPYAQKQAQKNGDTDFNSEAIQLSDQLTNDGYTLPSDAKVNFDPSAFDGYDGWVKTGNEEDGGTISHAFLFYNNLTSNHTKSLSGHDTVSVANPNANDYGAITVKNGDNENGKINYIVPNNQDSTNSSNIHVGDTVIVVPSANAIPKTGVPSNYHYVIATNTDGIPSGRNQRIVGSMDNNGDFVPQGGSSTKDGSNQMPAINWNKAQETITYKNADDPDNIKQIAQQTWKPSAMKGNYVGETVRLSDTGLAEPNLQGNHYNAQKMGHDEHYVDGEPAFNVQSPDGSVTVNVTTKGGVKPSNDPNDRSHYVPGSGKINPGWNPRDNNGKGGNTPYLPDSKPVPQDKPGNTQHHNIIPSNNHNHFDPNNPDDHNGMVPEVEPDGKTVMVPAKDISAVQADFHITANVNSNDAGGNIDGTSIPVDVDILPNTSALNTPYKLSDSYIRNAIVNSAESQPGGYTDAFGQHNDLYDDSISQSGNNAPIYYELKEDSNGQYHAVQTDQYGNTVNGGDNDNVSVGDYRFTPSEAILNYDGKILDRNANTGQVTVDSANKQDNKVESVKAMGYLGENIDPANNSDVRNFLNARGWTLNTSSDPQEQRQGSGIILTGDYNVKDNKGNGYQLTKADNNSGLVQVGTTNYGGNSHNVYVAAGYNDKGNPVSGKNANNAALEYGAFYKASDEPASEPGVTPTTQPVAPKPRVNRDQGQDQNQGQDQDQNQDNDDNGDNGDDDDIELSVPTTPDVKTQKSVKNILNTAHNLRRAINHSSADVALFAPMTPTVVPVHTHKFVNHDNGNGKASAGQKSAGSATQNNGSKSAQSKSAQKTDHAASASQSKSNVAPSHANSSASSKASSKTNSKANVAPSTKSSANSKSSAKSNFQSGSLDIAYYSNDGSHLVGQHVVYGVNGATVPTSDYINNVPNGYHIDPHFDLKMRFTFDAHRQPAHRIPVILNDDGGRAVKPKSNDNRSKN